MRLIKLTVAAALAAFAVPGAACDLDGPGGHRFFAFAGMYRGGAMENPSPEADKSAQKAPQRSEQDRQGADGPAPSSSEPDSEEPAPGEPNGSGSDSQPEDPAVLR